MSTLKKNEYFLGVDIGATSTDVVLMDGEKEIIDFGVIKTTPIHKEGVLKLAERILKKNGLSFSNVNYSIATGYGRDNVPFSNEVITEVTCHAKGAHYFFTGIKTIIDIGGQDSKIIICDKGGNVENFAMNDKCAAGTGRFLEVLSGIMDIPIAEIGEYSLNSKKEREINSTCTVFAESEVITELALGIPAEDILSGVFNTLAKRVYSLGKRFGYPKEIAFTGGVARNIGVAKKFENILETELKIPSNPDIVGALGAALYAVEKYKYLSNKIASEELNDEHKKRFFEKFNVINKKNPLEVKEIK